MNPCRYFGFVQLLLLTDATLHHRFQRVGRSVQLGITTTPLSTVSSDDSQELNNETQSLSQSVQDELDVIEKEIGTIREQVSIWMSDPYNQQIVMPIFIGVLSALVTMGLFYLAKRCCRKYQMRRRQSYVISPEEKALALSLFEGSSYSDLTVISIHKMPQLADDSHLSIHEISQSADEMLDDAARCKPLSVEVNQTCEVILHLAKPLADINELIETNLKVYNDRKVDIENTKPTINGLRQKLLIPKIGIKIEKLDHPRTVCAGPQCIETQSIPNSEQLQPIYKQICHDPCGFDPEPRLQHCAAMQSGHCKLCGCLWSTHMHIHFKQVKTDESVEDEHIKYAIETNEDPQTTKQKIIEWCKKVVKEYEGAQKKLMDTSIRFAIFLKQNATMACDDVFENYVEKLIEGEEKCMKAGGDRTKLANLERFLDEYRQGLAAFERTLRSSGNQQITTVEVKSMKASLFDLPHVGAKLKELFEQTKKRN